MLDANWSLARVAFDKIPAVSFARNGEARQRRYERVAEALLAKDPSFPVENCNYDLQDWAFSRYNISLFPLSFYDFPFALLSIAEVETLLSIES